MQTYESVVDRLKKDGYKIFPAADGVGICVSNYPKELMWSSFKNKRDFIKYFTYKFSTEGILTKDDSASDIKTDKLESDPNILYVVGVKYPDTICSEVSYYLYNIGIIVSSIPSKGSKTQYIYHFGEGNIPKEIRISTKPYNLILREVYSNIMDDGELCRKFQVSRCYHKNN